jgi:hypothetical protein
METLQTGTTSGVVSQLMGQGGEVLPGAPSSIDDIPAGKTLVCIFDTGHGEQAVPVTSPELLIDMNPPNSGMPRIFMLMDTTAVKTEAEAPEPEAEAEEDTDAQREHEPEPEHHD